MSAARKHSGWRTFGRVMFIVFLLSFTAYSCNINGGNLEATVAHMFSTAWGWVATLGAILAQLLDAFFGMFL